MIFVAFVGFALMALVSGMLTGAATDADLPTYARRALRLALVLQVIAQALVLVSLVAAI